MSETKKRKHILALVAQAITIGVLSGIVSVVFNYVLNFTIGVTQDISKEMAFGLLIVPIIAGLIIGLIRQFALKDSDQGFGVAQVMLELDRSDTLMMKPKHVLYKILGTFVTLSSGFSAGRQGPVVHIGGAIGANVAYLLKKNDDETRILIGCGVAGCMSGVFNAPIFATIFVIEVLFNKRYLEHITPILLSSVSSVIFITYTIGKHPFIKLTGQFTYAPSEIFYFIVLGVVTGLLAVVYIESLHGAKRMFSKVQTTIIRTTLGGIMIGLILYFIPNLYVHSYDSIGYIISGNYTIQILFLILVMKVIMTAITIGSGGIGGVFTPGLYLGAISGLAVGKTLQLFHFGLLDPKTYAVVGMAAMFAGFANAPLAATIMVTELTGHYELIFPILITTVTSSLVSEFLLKESIYTLEHENLLRQ